MFRDDNDILRLYLFDKQKGFKALFEKYYKPLCLFASRLTGDLQAAEDIVQSVFVTCWEKDALANIQSSLSSYLHISVRNRYLNKIKTYKREKLAESQQLEAALQPVLMAAIPDFELIDATEKAIKKLPDRCREVFEAVVFEKLSYMEAANKLGVSVNTIKTQLSRALAKLRKDLKTYI